MIKILKSELCCGCAACVQKCPKQCISFHEDSKGFCYPEVNESLCVDCGLCEKVCPIINKREPGEQPKKVIAFKNQDDEIRKKSSSGGFFTVLAEKIIDEGGVVFGARFDERWNVVHSYTETKEGLAAFRCSKYVQSYIGDSFKEVETFLKSGRKVLFTGTPCQVSALHLFLRKDHDNLYTMDFVCHGVPSPGVFRWYLQGELNEIARKGNKNTVSLPTITSIPKGDVLIPKGIKIKDIRFRDKSTGWKKYSFALDLTKATAEGEKIQFTLSKDLTQHPFLRGFIGDLYLRPSCYNCPAKALSSRSDFTVADFWGQEDNFPNFDNNTGVSAVTLNTDKSHLLASSFFNGHKSIEKDFNIFYQHNPSFIHCVKLKRTSAKFWKLYGKYSFEETLKRTYKNNIIDIYFKIKNRIIK